MIFKIISAHTPTHTLFLSLIHPPTEAESKTREYKADPHCRSFYEIIIQTFITQSYKL